MEEPYKSEKGFILRNMEFATLEEFTRFIMESVENLNDTPVSSYVGVTNGFDDAPKSDVIN